MIGRRLYWNVVSSILQVVFSALTLFITYRLLTHYLSFTEIGLWSLVVGSTAVARLGEFGLGPGVTRFVASDMGNGENARAAQTVSMCVVAMFVAVGTVAVLAYVWALPSITMLAPAPLRSAVQPLLACAIGGVVIGSVSNVFIGAIDGANRMDVRAVIQVSGNLIQLAATYLVMTYAGLPQLGYVQLAQGSFLLIVGGIYTVRLIGAHASAYFTFDGLRFRAILGYGGGLQLGGIVQVLFDPLIKVLLTAFGGLSLTGYYDLANRLVLQLRSLIIAAYTALVPYVAARVGNGNFNTLEVKATYIRAARLLTFVLLPFAACIAAALPLMFRLWIGRFVPTLLVIGLIQLVAWSINSLNVPAYYLSLALGRVRPFVVSNIVMGFAAVMLAVPLGALLGGIAVLFGAGLAMAFGAFYLIVDFHRAYHVRSREVIGRGNLAQLVLVGVAVLTSSAIAHMADHRSVELLILLMPPIVITVAAVVIALVQPEGRHILAALCKLTVQSDRNVIAP